MDWAAYTDSFTNEMHERPTIVEWVDETVKEVVSRRPSSVVEMGCGKGMILYKVASAACVGEYVGCDLSRLAVKHVERIWKTRVARPIEACAEGEEPISCKLSTYVCDASNFSGLREEGYDAVVCNGVSMYFPSASYLVDVLKAGLPKIVPTGAYHFGDVISKAHYDLFLLRRSRHFEGTFASLQDPSVRESLLAAAKDRCFDHELFYALLMSGALPGVAAVEVQLKHGEIMSEFTRYRYNVILHKGPQNGSSGPITPLELVQVAPDDVPARESAEAVASALKALAAASPRAAVACHAVRNARLTADALLFGGEEDAAAPAVQIGKGAGGGVDPAAVRAAIAAALPKYHIVLQWARDGKTEHMDVYAFPLARDLSMGEAYPVGEGEAALPVGTADLAPGLLAVMRSATALAGSEQLAARPVEAFTNQLQTVDSGSKGSNGSDEAAKAEARKLWQDGAQDPKARKAAVLMLIGAQLGAGGPVSPSGAFAETGGNSFVAMQTVGAVKALFGVSMPVFELLTTSFGAFADGVVAKASGGSGEEGTSGWISAIDNSTKWGRQTSLSAPTFVFFPQAGSSPKHYAGVYTALSKHCPLARYLFVQPPGRDAREGEPNETDYKKLVGDVSAALKPYLVGRESTDGQTTFIGDSWGAIAAYAVAHELREQCGWTPTHVVVSGNASPAVTSTHNGLGSYSSAPMSELSDKELLAFLMESGVSEEELGSPEEHATLLTAFRADCQLYEDYKRPAGLPKLNSKLMVMLGKEDHVTSMADALGWVEEFDSEQVTIMRVPGATHHVHEEQPEAVATHLINMLGIESRKPRVLTVERLALSPGMRSPARSRELGNQPSPQKKQGSLMDFEEVKVTLAPPEAFVRDVDAAKLQQFREGNLLYRMGSSIGSKGELSSLLSMPSHSTGMSRTGSEEAFPERTASPF